MDKERLASIKSRCSLMFFIQRIDSTRTKTILTEINEMKGKGVAVTLAGGASCKPKVISTSK
jgi:hypothetical protein